MSVQSPELAALAKDPALAPFIRDGVAVIVWASTGGTVLWASEAAREFVESVAPGGRLPEGSVLRGRLDVLASGLAPRKGVKLERLRLSPEPGAEVLTCACHILALPSDNSALLTAVVGRMPAIVRTQVEGVDSSQSEPAPKADSAPTQGGPKLASSESAPLKAGASSPLMTGPLVGPGPSMAALALTVSTPMPIRPQANEPVPQPVSTSPALDHVRQLSQTRQRVRFVWETDAEGRFTRVAPDLAEALGEASAAILGTLWWDLIGQRVMDPSGQVAEAFEQRMTWTARDILWRIGETDGAVLVDLSAVPMGDAHGQFAGFRGFGICRLDTLRRYGVLAASASPHGAAHAPVTPAPAPLMAQAARPPEAPALPPQPPAAEHHASAPVAPATTASMQGLSEASLPASAQSPEPPAISLPAPSKPEPEAPYMVKSAMAAIARHQSAGADFTPPGWLPAADNKTTRLSAAARLRADIAALMGHHSSLGSARFNLAMHAKNGQGPAKLGRGTLGLIATTPFIARKGWAAPAADKTSADAGAKATPRPPVPQTPTPPGMNPDMSQGAASPGAAPTPAQGNPSTHEKPPEHAISQAPAPTLAVMPPPGKVAVRVPGHMMPFRTAAVASPVEEADDAPLNAPPPGIGLMPPLPGRDVPPILPGPLSFQSPTLMRPSSMAGGARFPARIVAKPAPDPTPPAEQASPAPEQIQPGPTRPDGVSPAHSASGANPDVDTPSTPMLPADTVAGVVQGAKKIPPVASATPHGDTRANAPEPQDARQIQPQAEPAPRMEPAHHVEPEAPSRPVSPPSQPVGPAGLSGSERATMREIARALGERRVHEPARAVDAVPAAPIQNIPDTPAPVVAPVPGPEVAQATETPDAVEVPDMLGMSQDELERMTRNEQLAGLLDDLPAGIIVVRDEELLYANTAFLMLAGASDVEEIEQAGGIGSLLHGQVKSGPHRGAPLALVDLEGNTLLIDARLSRIMWDDELASLITCELLRESDDQPRLLAMELDAKAKQARIDELASILDTATDGVVVLDKDGRVVSLNRSAEALFGYEQAEVAGEPFTILLASESHPAAIDYLDGMKSNGVASILNDGRDIVGKVRQGGHIPLFMTLGRINDHGEEKFCAVLRDMTAWKKAETELVEARRSAERASSQKSDFLAKISHEIRTPLNAIIGFAEVMLEERFGAIGNDRYKDYLRDIHASGGHVISLVNDLLDLAKIEAGRVEMNFVGVDVNDLAANCVSLLQPQANRDRIVLRTSLTPKLPPVVADERSLRQVMLNILSNAVKFTDSGGQVIVSTAMTDRGEIALRVRDTGIGMSEPEVRAALEPFRQLATSRRGGGTGLGLPLTKAMVEANRGQFVISSAKGEGTLIEVIFPPTRVLAS